MPDRSVKVVGSRFSPKGELGQRYLASGVRTSMRLWEEVEPGEVKAPSRRDYETLGCLIKGSAELHLEGQMVLLYPGDCWLVPKGAVHSCKVLQTFTAIEVTRPPAQIHGRDVS